MPLIATAVNIPQSRKMKKKLQKGEVAASLFLLGGIFCSLSGLVIVHELLYNL